MSINLLSPIQGHENRFTEASAIAISGRLAETQAVVNLMNVLFKHSEFGPLRAETVLKSSRAQVRYFHACYLYFCFTFLRVTVSYPIIHHVKPG